MHGAMLVPRDVDRKSTVNRSGSGMHVAEPVKPFSTTLGKRLTLGVALGSGSARGWAHVGVLRALAEQGIAPDYIAGCSMGAMVGAAVAAGRLEQLEAWALSLNWKGMVGLLDVGRRGGLIKGDRVLDFFHSQFVDCQFSELPLAFAAVATDLASGEEVWLREGKVSDAVRASWAVPGLFQPVLREGRYLVDGSVVNPVPVSLCRAMGADVVIAVDVCSDLVGRFTRAKHSAPATQSQRRRLMRVLLPWQDAAVASENDREALRQPSAFEALVGAIDIMQERIARGRLAAEPPNVLLTPLLGTFGSFDYYRATLAIAEGRAAVDRMLPAIREALAV
jgi:NTE family protein